MPGAKFIQTRRTTIIKTRNVKIATNGIHRSKFLELLSEYLTTQLILHAYITPQFHF